MSKKKPPEDRPGFYFGWAGKLVWVLFIVIILAMFGDVIFTPRPMVLSDQMADIGSQFLTWRQFGFDELRKGNLAQWCPGVFSGIPFFGEMQSALLYPPNFIYMILPLAKAINVTIALHVLLLGIFMYGWARYRGLSRPASFLSGVLLMFCGAHFMHIYAGHLPNLCTMAWAPLLFWSIDGWLAERKLKWVLTGILATTMQILSGHAQYFFYTAVAAGIYSVLRLIWSERRVTAGLGLAGIYAGGVTISAVQLLTTFQTTAESSRGVGVPFSFAAMFSFPPENLITLIAPGFFGSTVGENYWGRCYLWEMSLFIGVSGLTLALIGTFYGDRSTRKFSAIMAGICFILALGVHTPLFKFMYLFVPGFDKFRGNSKFIFLVSLFLVLPAGNGLDCLVQNVKDCRKKTMLLLFGFAVLLGLTAWGIQISSNAGIGGFWQRAMAAVDATHESYFSARQYESASFVREAGLLASGQLFLAAGTCLVLGLIVLASRYWNRAIYLAVLLGVLEVFIFARSYRPAFDLDHSLAQSLRQFSTQLPSGDYRVHFLQKPNLSLYAGLEDIWGNDPGVLKRYAEFIAFTQDRSPEDSQGFFLLTKPSPLLGLLRCRYIFITQNNEWKTFELKDSMPHLQLVGDYRVLKDRNAILSAMNSSAFDPRQTVILEQSPEPEPTKSLSHGTAKIVEASTDHLTIEADLYLPAILLITDPYSKDWQAKGLPGSSQQQYTVMAGNYVLRAIPLAKGHHRIRMEYLPSGFVLGKWISILACVGSLGLAG